MARQRKEPSIKLRQPDRSGPSEKTLLDLAQERNLFDQAKQREQENASVNRSKKADKKTGPKVDDDDDDVPDPAVLSPGAERLLESVLWVSTLSMLYFTLYVLVQNQYGIMIKWDEIAMRTAISWPIFFMLFHPLHPHAVAPPLVPSLLPARYQHAARQVIFFVMSTVCGCAVIQVTNGEGYLAVMKRAPPLACLWIWAVVELDLAWAALSLAIAAAYLWANGYSVV